MATYDEDSEELEELLEEAEAALDEGSIDHAIDLLEPHVDLVDAHPEVRAMYGLALFYAGEYDDAFDFLLEAVDHDPDDAESRGALGVCHFFRLEFVTAEKELRRAILTEEDWAEAHYWLGRVVEFQGRYPQAMVSFQKAQALDPEHYQAPRRIRDEDLDSVMQDAIAGLPDRIRTAIDDVAVLVEEYPTEELLRETQPPFPPDILGIFTGVSKLDAVPSGALPSTIHIFRRNVEHFVGEREEVVDELRVTLLHEVGHSLGMDEEELEALGLE
jgi:predicted Zn-dependent protease with MMP-like domain/Flp pilus assembly protein TadD